MNRALIIFAVSFSWGCDVQGDVSVSTSSDTKGGPGQGAQGQGGPGQGAPAAEAFPGTLTFVEPGDQQRVVTAQEILESFKLESFVVNSVNYKGKKSFVALPLAPVLRKYFAEEQLSGESAQLTLTARDGYSADAPAEIMLSPDVYLAVGHQSPGDFDPIGDRGADPRPFSVVWKGDKYSDEKKYPRPWALSQIEVYSSSERYPHTKPASGFGDNKLARQGHELFSQSCIRCHAMNQEGGRVGPDLNVPQNILAYRPEQKVRAYIKNPGTFRYSSMPAHPDFEEEDLDALIAYFRIMGQHQHDPNHEAK